MWSERGQARKEKNASMREAASVVSSSLIVVSKMFWSTGGKGETRTNCSYMEFDTHSMPHFLTGQLLREGQRGNLKF